MTSRPPKSNRFVCGPPSAAISLVLPNATMRSLCIARASTYGCAESLVKILPLSKIISGDCCCAVQGCRNEDKIRIGIKELRTISSHCQKNQWSLCRTSSPCQRPEAARKPADGSQHESLLSLSSGQILEPMSANRPASRDRRL